MSLQEPTKYNDYIGPETINCEYKEFTFNLSGIEIDTKLAETYCKTNKFEFNKQVIFNLKKYFKIFLPKYACGYLNSYACGYLNYEMNSTIYIGINDIGIVKGIPFKGNIPMEYLKNKIYNILDKNIINNKIQKINWKEIVDIKFIKLEHDILIEPNTLSETFTNYLKKKIIFMKKYDDYVKQTIEWRKSVIFLITRLVDLANNMETRNQIIDYIKLHDPLNEVINIMQSKDFNIEYKNHDELLQIKDNPSEPYYWITRWKDMIIDKNRASKPVLTSTFNKHNTPLNLLVSVNEMIPYWISNNTNMNLYVIKINFKSNTPMLDTKYIGEINTFSYYNIKTNKIAQCYRTVLSNGDPVCLPL
jgi:hypothetical protein